MLSTLLPARIRDKRIVVAAVLAAFLVVFFVVVAIAQGIGNPSVPSGDVAEFQAALEQAAARQGVKKVPAPSDPSYATLHDAAMSDVLLSRWVRGEANDRGITFSNSEISSQLQQVVKQQFGGQKKFQQFLKQAHFTPPQARDRVELQMISNEIQKQVLPQNASVPDSEIK